ncbi:phosphodiesterase [Paracoccus sp. S-4012]|uniref:glycerophosphodiester phosphodiesterase family protein n=1 Tax=Paracoccus sp. S-4012 TaxID=2665648 RepID=UPI0012B11B80|nr:glycerophosphodiester phosphodiesterase family protein [Paracoccus sp. S-4012]MRX49796.1 phosphodiesterase [Paracoccus sp. S-4012]
MPAPPLPRAFLDRPIAHRGLHGPGVPENSLAAIRAAADAGYGIEIDIQQAAGGEPVVFHDYDLQRMVGSEGYVADTTLEELAKMKLGTTAETIPSLAEVLRDMKGRAPLLIEIKDQDGRLGANTGDLQDRVAAMLVAYDGPVAVMSFNPHAVTAFHAAAPGIPAGLVTCGFEEDDWPMLDEAGRAKLSRIEDFERSEASFVSHDHRNLANPAVAALKARGVPVLAWTLRSEEAARAARAAGADNVTFEGYEARR